MNLSQAINNDATYLYLAVTFFEHGVEDQDVKLD